MTKFFKLILIFISTVIGLWNPTNVQAHDRPIRVLIIDDEVPLQKLLVIALKRLGLTDVDLTESTDGAREKIEGAHSEDRPYEIIISDNHLIERDNQLLIEIRKDLRNDRMKILYSSGELATMTAARIYLALGVDTILPKPYLTAELNTAIQLLVSKIRNEDRRLTAGNVDNEECSTVFRRITSSQGD